MSTLSHVSFDGVTEAQAPECTGYTPDHSARYGVLTQLFYSSSVSWTVPIYRFQNTLAQKGSGNWTILTSKVNDKAWARIDFSSGKDSENVCDTFFGDFFESFCVILYNFKINMEIPLRPNY